MDNLQGQFAADVSCLFRLMLKPFDNDKLWANINEKTGYEQWTEVQDKQVDYEQVF